MSLISIAVMLLTYFYWYMYFCNITAASSYLPLVFLSSTRRALWRVSLQMFTGASQLIV